MAGMIHLLYAEVIPRKWKRWWTFQSVTAEQTVGGHQEPEQDVLSNTRATGEAEITRCFCSALQYVTDLYNANVTAATAVTVSSMRGDAAASSATSILWTTTDLHSECSSF